MICNWQHDLEKEEFRSKEKNRFMRKWGLRLFLIAL